MSDSRKNIFTIPNLLSFLRILLIPVIIYLYCAAQDYPAAVLMLLVSSATDVADGIIARKFNMISDLGKVLDPIADKLTQGAIMICLVSRYPFILWLIILFAAKELTMFFMGYLTLKYAHSVNSAEWFGKACTVIIVTSMAVLILFPQIELPWVKGIIALDAAAVVISLILYVRFYISIWKKAAEESGGQCPGFLKRIAGKDEGKKKSDLGTRIKTGFILTVIMSVIIVFSGHRAVLNIFCAILSAMAAYELYRNIDSRCEPAILILLFAAFGIAVSLADMPDYFTILEICYPVFVTGGILFLLNLEHLKGKNFPVRLPVALMAPLFFRAIPELRRLDNGLFLLILAIGVPVLTDIFAYLIGRKIGKRRIAPAISPNKTLAGSIGGTLVSTLLMFLVSEFFFRPSGITSTVWLMIYLITASLLAQIGDLLLSGVKRVIGIKDFSRILPGHGGILDRFDSIMLVAPYTLIFAVGVL